MSLSHRHGGTITRLTHVGHSTHLGVADWFFVGDVNWNDGRQSRGIEIAPFALCGSPEDLRGPLAALNNYLQDAGRWLDEPQHKRDGRIVHWVAHTKAGRSPITGAVAEAAGG